MPRNLNASDMHFQEALAHVLEEEVDFPPGILVTLVKAHITPDTKHATGTLSVLPVAEEAEALRSVREFEHEIKDALGKRLRLRRIPRLHWEFDRTERTAADIEETLNMLEERGEI